MNQSITTVPAEATPAEAAGGTAELPLSIVEPIQHELFVVEDQGQDWSVKDDISSMEHPIFALAKTPSREIRTYSRGGKTLRIIPSAVGSPTVFDKDLVIYLVSHLVKGLNGKQPVSRRVRIDVHPFLVATRRSTGGASYTRVLDMCRRLRGTTIETNIRTTEEERTKGFGLIEDYDVIAATKNGKGALVLEVVISDWLYRAAVDYDVLTLNPEYFSLTQALERRVYELARKHCGDQAWWTISLPLLQEKTGSTQSARKWKQEIKAMVQADALPDYRMALDESVRPNVVIFLTRDSKKLLQQANKADKVAWLGKCLQKSLH